MTAEFLYLCLVGVQGSIIFFSSERKERKKNFMIWFNSVISALLLSALLIQKARG